MDTIISALTPSSGKITTVAPGGETLYLVDEKPISEGIRHYLAHLLGHKVVIDTSVHARSRGIATDIATKLLVHEQDFKLHKEGLAAHEFADPHNVSSLETGRAELSRFIEGIAIPLTGYTWSEHVHVDLVIGHNIPTPFAAQGMTMCVTGDCKTGVMRQRFAPIKEIALPSSESEIIHGMALILRPGKMGEKQVHEDRDRDQATKLLQSDASLYRWTAQTLLLLGNIKTMGDAKYGDAQDVALKEASDGLRANLLVLRVKREAAALAGIEGAGLVTAISLPYLENMQRALQSIGNLSPALNDAVRQIEREIKHDISEIKQDEKAQNRMGAEEHAASRTLLTEPLPHSPHAIHHSVEQPHPEEN